MQDDWTNLSGLFTPSVHMAMPEISCVALAPQASQGPQICYVGWTSISLRISECANAITATIVARHFGCLPRCCVSYSFNLHFELTYLALMSTSEFSQLSHKSDCWLWLSTLYAVSIRTHFELTYFGPVSTSDSPKCPTSLTIDSWLLYPPA